MHALLLSENRRLTVRLHGLAKFVRGNAQDIGALALLFALSFWVYGYCALRLSQGGYFDYLNLGFDFDPPVMVDYLSGRWPDKVNYKHPLLMLFSPFFYLFHGLGFSTKEAAGLVMALWGAATVALVYLFCRSVSVKTYESIAATMLFAASASHIFTSFIVETYGLASFSIVLVWCVYMVRRDSPQQYRALSVFSAVLAAGITITNIVHPLASEVACWFGRIQHRLVAVRLMLLGVTVLLLVMLGVALLQPDGLLNLLSSPVQSAREVYWLVPEGERVGLSNLVATYFGFAFFSPDFTLVPLSRSVTMLDFRDWNFSISEQWIVGAWLVFWLIGLFFGLRHPEFRRVAIPLVAVVVMNLLFHLAYQYRGSVFIYAAHLHFPVFALGLGVAPWISSKSRAIRAAYILSLLLLGAGAAYMNIGRAIWFSEHFDSITYPRDAPEISPNSIR